MQRGVISVVLAALAACGGSGSTPAQAPKDWTQPAAALATQPLYAAVGERVRYRVAAFKVELAALTMATGEVVDFAGKKAVVLQAVAESVGLAARVKPVRVEFSSWIDIATSLPLLFRASEADEVIEARFTELADKTFPIVTKVGDAPEKLEQQVTAGSPLELLGTLLVLRAWDDKIGATRTFEAVRSSYMWRMQMTIAARETISTELGELPTLRIDSVGRRLLRDGSVDAGTEPRKFSVWISDDADRVPLRMVAETDYGDIELAIVDYVAGQPL